MTKSEPLKIEVGEVIGVLRGIKPNKATGPDGLRGVVLKECAVKLGHVCTKLFEIFLDAGFVPVVWKNTIVIPVPKTPNTRALRTFTQLPLHLWCASAWSVYWARNF